MAHLTTRCQKYNHIIPILDSLHWLLVKQHIVFKVLVLTFKALHDLAPQYLKLYLCLMSLSGIFACPTNQLLRCLNSTPNHMEPGPLPMLHHMLITVFFLTFRVPYLLMCSRPSSIHICSNRHFTNLMTLLSYVLSS